MKAVFLDRDGVINELIYYPEQGTIDSPFIPEQFRLSPGVSTAISKFHELSYKVIVVSNQPGIAKGYLTLDTFEKMKEKMKAELSQEGTYLDGEYYCLHHPEAKVVSYRENCDCRKPKPGMLLEAARKMNLNLAQSWMIGDGLTDIQAGKAAGCKTIILGRMKCELCRMMDDMSIKPDYIAKNLYEASRIIAQEEVHLS